MSVYSASPVSSIFEEIRAMAGVRIRFEKSSSERVSSADENEMSTPHCVSRDREVYASVVFWTLMAAPGRTKYRLGLRMLMVDPTFAPEIPNSLEYCRLTPRAKARLLCRTR